MTNTLHPNPDAAPEFTDFGALNPNTDPAAAPENQPQSRAGEAITRVANWINDHRRGKKNDAESEPGSPEDEPVDGEHTESKIAYRGLLRLEGAKETAGYKGRQAKRFMQRIGARASERSGRWGENIKDSLKNAKITLSKWDYDRDGSPHLSRQHRFARRDEVRDARKERRDESNDRIKSLEKTQEKDASLDRYRHLSAQARIQAQLHESKANKIEGLFNRSESVQAKLEAERRKQERQETRARRYGEHGESLTIHHRLMEERESKGGKLVTPEAEKLLTPDRWYKRVSKLPENLQWLGDASEQDRAIVDGSQMLVEYFMKQAGIPESGMTAIIDRFGANILDEIEAKLADKLPTESDKRRFVYDVMKWHIDEERAAKNNSKTFNLDTMRKRGLDQETIDIVMAAVLSYANKKPATPKKTP